MRISDWSSDVCSSDLRLELLAAVAQEPRPVLGTGDDALELRHHLAAVAHAQREAVAAGEEGFEHVAQRRALEDRGGPAAAGAEHVAVAEATDGDHAGERRQVGAAGDEVAHVHVDGLEAARSEEHTSEIQSLMRITYSVL